MRAVFDGIAASPGIVIGPARVLQWDTPRVPVSGTVPPNRVDAEIGELREACEWAKGRTRRLRDQTAERLGEVEAQIFDPQLLMLEDADLVEAAVQLIRENQVTAARAFEWRVLEWESQWSHTAHPMVMDKLNDLADIQARVLRRLLQLPEPDVQLEAGGPPVILVARDLSPSVAAGLDSRRIAGIATDAGTRTSHSAILSRSLDIPSVVSLGTLSEYVRDGQELILDGRRGRVIVEPTEKEKEKYQRRDFHLREWEQELLLLAHLDSETRDGAHVALRANIDLPIEAVAARSHGAAGVGLFRTEFLVVGRHSSPTEEEQYRAYGEVLSVFRDAPVVVRTFDLGGDKFPAFLHMPREDNPFLGWRAIRVCLDEPELFRAQLRALLRASNQGDLRVMLPLINGLDEIAAARAMLEEEADALRAAGTKVHGVPPLGIMIETPAAAMMAGELASHADFFSVGTNDLVQYTLAVDRGNARLAPLYNPFHPGVLRLLRETARAAKAAGIEAGVCGEMASNPLGAFLLIGMGYDCLSVGPASLAEVKKVIRTVHKADAEAAVRRALAADSPAGVIRLLTDHLPAELDLSLFGGPWSLSAET